MLLIHPDQSERARVMMDRYVGIIEGGQGQVHRREDLGRRMLAYPIAKVQKGHYMLMNVECGQETLDELVGALHFSDAVLRHLVIRRDEAVTQQSVLARAVEKEAARENREFPYDRELAHGRRARRGKGSPARAKAGASGGGVPADETGQAAAAKKASGAGAEPAGEESQSAAGAEQPGEEAQSAAGAEQPGEESQSAVGESSEAADGEPAAEAESGTAGQADGDAAPEDQAGPDADADPDVEPAPKEDAAAGQTEDEDPKESKA